MTPSRAISVFYHVATLNSVTAAEQALGVTPSAVSQQIRSLEDQIGTALITRAGRTVKLTEAGERYFELVADQVAGIISSTDLMKGTATATRLTIRATPSISTKWLLPRLPEVGGGARRGLVRETRVAAPFRHLSATWLRRRTEPGRARQDRSSATPEAPASERPAAVGIFLR
jgi:DNA-binding transcriptional LysR family regulator